MRHFQPQQPARYPSIAFLFLLLYMAAIYIRPQEWTAQFAGLPVVRVTLIASFSLFLFLYSPKRGSPQLVMMLMLCALIPISGLRNGWLGGGIYEAQLWIIHSLLPFIVVCGIVVTEKRHMAIVWLSITAALIMVHHGHFQVNDPNGIGWTGMDLSQGTRITYTGIFNDPNDLGMFLLMNIPLTYLLIKRSNSSVMKLAYLSVIGLLIYGIVLTNSRGTLVGLLAYLTSYVWLRFGWKRAAWLMLLMIPAALLALGKFRTIDASEASAYGRVEAWYDGFQMLKYHPIFGVAKGGFTEYHVRTAHNSYVLILAELGLIGYVLWSMTVMLSLWMAFTLMKAVQQPHLIERFPALKREAELAEALMFSLICYCATAFFLSRSYIIFLYIFIGLIVAQFHRAQQITEQHIAIPKGLLGRLFGLSLLSIIGLYIIMRILL